MCVCDVKQWQEIQWSASQLDSSSMACVCTGADMEPSTPKPHKEWHGDNVALNVCAKWPHLPPAL